MEPTADDLKKILADHALWLESDQEKGDFAYLAGADLTGADLPGARLSWADLTEAKLTNANLTDAFRRTGGKVEIITIDK